MRQTFDKHAFQLGSGKPRLALIGSRDGDLIRVNRFQGLTKSQVVLSSGRVDRLMKVVEVRGFSFTGSPVNLHVSNYQPPSEQISTYIGAIINLHVSN